MKYLLIIVSFLNINSVHATERASSVQAEKASEVDKYLECAKLAIKHELNVSREYSDLEVTSAVESWDNGPFLALSDQDWYYYEAKDKDSNKFNGYIKVQFQEPLRNPRTGRPAPDMVDNLYCTLARGIVSHSFQLKNEVGDLIYKTSHATDSINMRMMNSNFEQYLAINVGAYSCVNQQGPCERKNKSYFDDYYNREYYDEHDY